MQEDGGGKSLVRSNGGVPEQVWGQPPAGNSPVARRECPGRTKSHAPSEPGSPFTVQASVLCTANASTFFSWPRPITNAAPRHMASSISFIASSLEPSNNSPRYLSHHISDARERARTRKQTQAPDNSKPYPCGVCANARCQKPTVVISGK